MTDDPLREELLNAIERVLKQPAAKSPETRRHALRSEIDQVLGTVRQPALLTKPALLTIRQASAVIRKSGVCFKSPERTLREWAYKRSGEIQAVEKSRWEKCYLFRRCDIEQLIEKRRRLLDEALAVQIIVVTWPRPVDSKIRKKFLTHLNESQGVEYHVLLRDADEKDPNPLPLNYGFPMV